MNFFIVLTIVLVEGISQISYEALPATMMRAQKYFQEVGVKVRMQRLSVENLGCENTDFLEISSEIACYHRSRRLLGLTKRELVYFLVEGWEDSTGQYYIGGNAIDVCSTTAMGTAHDYEVSNIPKDDLNGDILAHEILHTMCATHTEPINLRSIMSRGLWDHWTDSGILPVLDITKHQVKRWKMKRRRQ